MSICNAKNSIRFKTAAEDCPEKIYAKVCDSFLSKGVDSIVGGCTDISNHFF